MSNVFTFVKRALFKHVLLLAHKYDHIQDDKNQNVFTFVKRVVFKRVLLLAQK